MIFFCYFLTIWPLLLCTTLPTNKSVNYCSAKIWSKVQLKSELKCNKRNWTNLEISYFWIEMKWDEPVCEWKWGQKNPIKSPNLELALRQRQRGSSFRLWTVEGMSQGQLLEMHLLESRLLEFRADDPSPKEYVNMFHLMLIHSHLNVMCVDRHEHFEGKNWK